MGCQNSDALTPSKESEDEYKENELPIANSGAEGISLGFYDNKEIINERTFHLKGDKSTFNRELVLGNKTKQDQEFVLLVFDHAKQISFKMDGEQKDHHIFKANKGSYKTISVELEGLKDGFHSISYLILRSPNKKIDDIDEALAYSQLYSVRVNILKNINEIPENKKLIKPNNEVSNEGVISGLFLGEADNKYKGKLKQKKSSFSYNLVYGNKWDREVDFYIVSLLNWKQIDINNKTPYIYDKLKPEQEVSLITSINEQQLTEDKNIAVSIFLPNPYKELTADDSFVDADFESSNRIFIE